MQLESLKHLHRYADAILASIAEHYETGKIQNPRENHSLMSLFSLLCEGKIDGYVPKDDPISPKWRLNESAYDSKYFDEDYDEE